MENRNIANLAKINQPVTESVLLREHLFQRLDEARSRSLIFMSAPAGSGKTTLISSYIQTGKTPCLWYQIDSGDADLATFFYYLGLAGKNAAPKKVLEFPVFSPEHCQGIPEFSRDFFAAIYDCLPSEAVIVFDDCHEVGDTAPFYVALLAALDRIPQDITIILLSRFGPPVRFSRLFTNRQGTLFKWDDLRFSLDEFEAAVSLWQNGVQPDGSLVEMYEVMDGWVGGLHLITAVGTRQGSVKITETPPQEVFDYFFFEAFSQLDESLQDFLIKTAILSPVSVTMAEKISGNKNAATLLEKLHRKNYFTNKKQQTEVVYNYHPLFKGFLLQQAAKQLTGEELKALCHDATDLLLDAQQYEGAVECLRQTANWERLATIIPQYAPVLMAQGRNLTLLKWFEYLPEDIIRNNPWMSYWRGLAVQPYNQADALVWLSKSFQQFENQNDLDGSFLSWSAVANTYAFEWNDFSKLDDWLDWFEENCQAERTSASLDMAMSFMQALMIRRPQHPEIARWISIVLALAKRCEDKRTELQAFSFIINYYIWLGEYHQAEIVMAELHRLADSSDSTPLTVLTYKRLSVGLHLWGKSFSREKALELIDESLALARKSGIHVWDHMFLALRVNGLIMARNFKEADELLDQIAKTLTPSRKHGYCHYHYLRAWNYFRRNDFEKAQMHNQTALQIARETGYVFPVILCLLEAANIYCSLRQFDQAQSFLKNAEKINQSVQSRNFQFMIFVTQAKIFYGIDDEHRGDVALTAAFNLGKQQQYFCMFCWSDSVGMEMLCSKALEKNIESNYVKKYIKNMGLLPPGPNGTENWPWPLRIYTLGRFSLVINDKPLRFSGRTQQRPLDLLKALIALGGREVSEEKINDALWPDADGDLQHQTFSTTLHRLRKLLGIKEALLFNNSKLTLDDRYCWVDAWAFERLLGQAEKCRQAHADPAKAASFTEKSVALYKGRFLNDSQAAWAIRLQERCRSRYLDAMAKLGEFHESCGDLAAAIKIYQTALEFDPLVEEFYRRLMLCYQKAGDLSEAVATYKRCAEILFRVLVVQPSAKTTEIYLAVSK